MQKALVALRGLGGSMNLRKSAVAAAPLLAMLASGANAQTAGSYTFDPTPIVTVITGGVTSVAAIGVAVISLVVVIKLFKWVQRVL